MWVKVDKYRRKHFTKWITLVLGVLLAGDLVMDWECMGRRSMAGGGRGKEHKGNVVKRIACGG